MRKTLAGMALMAGLILLQHSALAEPRKAAFFGILLLNTSVENVSDAERARLSALEAQIVEGLEASGKYSFVDTAPVANKAKLYANLSNCNGCDSDLAKELGADVAVTGEVQKTSNLILSMSIYIRDAETGALVAGGSADMRGNTDQIWNRTGRWVLKNRLLAE